MSCKISSVLIRIGWSGANPDSDPTFYFDDHLDPNAESLQILSKK
jgi:hypothetical protein